jgi:hypothetical protein
MNYTTRVIFVYLNYKIYPYEFLLKCRILSVLSACMNFRIYCSSLQYSFYEYNILFNLKICLTQETTSLISQKRITKTWVKQLFHLIKLVCLFTSGL